MAADALELERDFGSESGLERVLGGGGETMRAVLSPESSLVEPRGHGLTGRGSGRSSCRGGAPYLPFQSHPKCD